MIKISPELKRLAEIFSKNGSKLYIVGGYVRDGFLRVHSQIRDDIDLCSNVTPKKLKTMLEGSEFEVSNINESFGVMAIKGLRRYEHATFRKEVYESEGHAPDIVEFVKNLEVDAMRRDFRINAIYYDILEETFVDPLGGILDLKEKIISTCRAPKLVLNDDPERILRMIRFACSLNLKIPEEEMFYAKQNAYKIAFISKTRLRNEFERLLTADEIYPDLLFTKDAHYKAMVLIGEIGAWKYILPAMHDMQKTPVVDLKGERIYDHILNCVRNSSPNIRLAVLLHDVGKVKTMERANNFFGSKEFVASIIESNLGINGLGYSKLIVKNVIKTVLGYDFDNLGFATTKMTKKFIFENYEVVENIIEIKNVVKNEGRAIKKKIPSAEKLRKVYNKMTSNNTPFDRKDLAINGDDLIKKFQNIRIQNLDDLLEIVLFKVAMKPKLNTFSNIMKLSEKIINAKKNKFLVK